ncbi:hypothetical protein KC362_g19294, partial [Hortaea werneckii]
MILKKRVTLQDMEGVDAEFHRTLTWAMENDITDVIYSTFSVEDERFGEKVTVELKPGGEDIEVTNENKQEYIELITEWRIQKRVEEQFNAFVTGFHELIQEAKHILQRLSDRAYPFAQYYLADGYSSGFFNPTTQ